MEAGFESNVIWRGGGLDRLLDERHVGLVSATLTMLRRLGWEVAVEVTYSVYGERGSIDILAFNAALRIALVIEVKTELTSVEQLGRKLHEKVRLVRTRLCLERFGWKPVALGRLVILPATDTARRNVAQNDAVLETLFPARGRDVRSWLRKPVGDIAGLLFVASTNGRSVTARLPEPTRVRKPPATAT